MLLLMKIIQNLYKPSKTIEHSPAIDFLNKVYWSGQLAKSKDGSRPKLNNMLQTFYRLAMDQFFDPDLWERHYVENLREAFSQESVQIYNLSN